MPSERFAVTEVSLTNRSRLTNGTRLLEGIDGRSAPARRFRDLVRSYSRDLGGVEGLTPAELTLVRQAAALTMRAEELQGAIVRGETIDPDELIRIASASRRTFAGIRKRAPKMKTLSEHLAAKRRAVA